MTALERARRRWLGQAVRVDGYDTVCVVRDVFHDCVYGACLAVLEEDSPEGIALWEVPTRDCTIVEKGKAGQ